MRLATYNVEWFDALFDDDGSLRLDGEWSSRFNVTRQQQLEALGLVFTALDADAIMVIEAPDTSRKRSSVRALSNFAEAFGLRTRNALTGFANDTQQEIALLYDPDTLTATHDPRDGGPGAPRFDGTYLIDLDVDATQDHVTFSKPPLEVAVQTVGGASLRLIGAHLKSKAPHGATTRDEVMRQSIANRRKQLAQAIWLQARVAQHVAAGDSLVVLGDLNDGPGLDEYEHLFGRSSVEIVMGDGAGALYDPHAALALQRRIGLQPTTSRFYLRHEKRFMQALLDYVMVSQDLMARSPRWRIWHPFDDPICWETPELRDALVQASDHFPVSIDLDI